MTKFALGKFALGISDRSGFQYKLNDMKLEWTGLLVGADEWEKKQPQLDPRRHVTDPQALKMHGLIRPWFYRCMWECPM